MDLNAIASSGLRTSAQALNLSAQNVANVNTEGYRARQLDQEALPQGGVRARSVRESQEPPEPQGSNVDLAQEAVTQVTSAGTYQAGLAVMRAQEQTLGQALDLKA